MLQGGGGAGNGTSESRVPTGSVGPGYGSADEQSADDESYVSDGPSDGTHNGSDVMLMTDLDSDDRAVRQQHYFDLVFAGSYEQRVKIARRERTAHEQRAFYAKFGGGQVGDNVVSGVKYDGDSAESKWESSATAFGSGGGGPTTPEPIRTLSSAAGLHYEVPSEEDYDHVHPLTYGEVTLAAMQMIIQRCKQIKQGLNVNGEAMAGCRGSDAVGERGLDGGRAFEAGGRGGWFYDLGSGAGRAVVAAALVHDFDYAGGVEILEGLHKLSIDAKRRWHDLWEEERHGYGELCGDDAPPPIVDFIQGDAADVACMDWRRGDLIFVNSTCFDDEVMQKIADIAEGVRPGAFVCTLTRRLPSECFVYHGPSIEFQMSWGETTVHFYERLS